MSNVPVSIIPVDASTLDDFSMLEGVGLIARRDLIASAVQRKLLPGEVLIEQSTRRDSMFLVLRGCLTVHIDSPSNDPVAEIRGGETVGELSVLDGSVASAFVVAREVTRVLVVQEEDFWTLINASHAFAVNLLLKMASRLRANNATVSQNVRKRRQYERAAMFDGLTGIHNRRWLDDTLHRLFRRSVSAGDQLSVSLIDIDHFKRFNDTYGHAAGDHVLTVVASTLSANLRPTDLVARFGGEEFVILFPSTSIADALVAAERVREAVATQALTTPDGVELSSVTISMGVAELSTGMSVTDLLKRADEAMYAAKQGGRNRVMASAP